MATAVPSSTPTSVLGVSLDEYRQKPRPRAVVNGILLGPDVAGPGGPAYCAVNEAAELRGETGTGTRLEIAASQLPADLAAAAGTPVATGCRGSVLGVHVGFVVPPGPATRGGPIEVRRVLAAYPAIQTDIPAEYWRPVFVGGFPAAIASPVVNGRSFVDLVAWDPHGVQTTLRGDFVSADLVERLALALFPPGAASTPDDPAHVAGTRTGTRVLDAVIEAVERGDAAGLARLVDPVSLACGHATATEARPGCEFGMPEGTPVERFPVTNCEVTFVRPDSAGDAFELLLAAKPRLFAAVRGGGPEPAWPAAAFGLVFVGDGRVARGVRISVGESGIVGLSYGCGPVNPASFLDGVPPSDRVIPPAK